MSILNPIIQTIKVRYSTVHYLFKFLWQNKMWWMIPMMLVLVIGFVVILLAQSSPVGPFIYTLF